MLPSNDAVMRYPLPARASCAVVIFDEASRLATKRTHVRVLQPMRFGSTMAAGYAQVS